MPDWFKLFKKGVDLAKRVQNAPEEAVPRRCFCGLPAKLVPTSEPTFEFWPPGSQVYRCPRGHEHSPGVTLDDPNRILDMNKGDTHGEI